MNIYEALKKQLINYDVNGNFSTTSDYFDVEKNLSNQQYDYPTYADYNHSQKTAQKTDGYNLRDYYIRMYRRYALRTKPSSAIEEIVNECVEHTDEGTTVKIDFKKDSDLEKLESTKKAIEESFKKALNLLNFEKNKYELFHDWYVDGVLPVEVVYDNKNLKNGIQGLLKISPIELREFQIDNIKKGYAYSSMSSRYYNITQAEFEQFEKKYYEEQLIMLESGLWDDTKTFQISYVRLAIKYINDLQNIENAITKYRITRSGMKYLWNVDVGSMSLQKAKQHLAELKNDISSNIEYDTETGEINSSYTEGITNDYLFPSRNGKNKTTLDTIEPTSDFVSKLDDLEYVEKGLYEGFKIPIGRLDKSSSLDFSNDDILREELKFTFFTSRLKNKFSVLFLELLKRDLIYSKKMSLDEFLALQNDIIFKWSNNNVIVENAKRDNMIKKIEAVELIEESGVVGKYVSKQYVINNILDMTESEYEEQKKQIEIETKNGEYKDIENEDE